MLKKIRTLRWAWALGLALGAGAAPAADFADLFANRQAVTGGSLVITGSNFGATKELNEPRHADKTGGHSVWISWLAPSNGLVSLTTTGSTFDTLLAVYTLEPGGGSPMERLDETAESDDDEGTTATGVFLRWWPARPTRSPWTASRARPATSGSNSISKA